jgi:hypothetical protein
LRHENRLSRRHGRLPCESLRNGHRQAAADSDQARWTRPPVPSDSAAFRANHTGWCHPSWRDRCGHSWLRRDGRQVSIESARRKRLSCHERSQPVTGATTDPEGDRELFVAPGLAIHHLGVASRDIEVDSAQFELLDSLARATTSLERLPAAGARVTRAAAGRGLRRDHAVSPTKGYAPRAKTAGSRASSWSRLPSCSRTRSRK